MPQPTLAAASNPTRWYLQFGNAPLPNGQGTMAWLDLDDFKNWFVKSIPELPSANRQIGDAQYAFRAKSTYLSDDFGPTDITIPTLYYEGTSFGGSATALGAAKANLMMAGDQFLTTDGVTSIPAKLKGFAAPKVLNPAVVGGPYWWELLLAFRCRVPWFSDIAASAVGAQAVTTSGSTFNVTYAGSVFAEPVWTFSVPNTNTAVISSLTLANTTAGEQLVITFSPSLTASTTWTVTIDSGKFSVMDQNGKSYDVNGTFPNLYGPAGQVNAFSVQAGISSGTLSGATVSASYNNRWMT